MGKYVVETLESLEYQYKTCLLAYQDGIVDQKTALDTLKRYCRALRQNDILCYDDYKIIYDNRMLKDFNFYVKKHRNFWSHIVEYMRKRKYDKYCFNILTIKEIFIPNRHILNKCYLCEYAFKYATDTELTCDKCPYKVRELSCLDGLYDNLCKFWDMATLVDKEVDLESREKAIKIAEQIRDLPCKNYWWRKNK